MKMNSKIVLDRRADQHGQPVVMVYGIIVGDDFGIALDEPVGPKKRIVGADTIIMPLPGKRFVEPVDGFGGHGSPEDILEHHLDFAHWDTEDFGSQEIPEKA